MVYVHTAGKCEQNSFFKLYDDRNMTNLIFFFNLAQAFSVYGTKSDKHLMFFKAQSECCCIALVFYISQVGVQYMNQFKHLAYW